MGDEVGVHWRRMLARDTGAEHRGSTPLEAFFDLCFVVAVSQASGQLQHALGEGHTGSGIIGYLMVFFAIWWAWMNFSWFASAYDTDDVLYRATTLIQMAGVLVLAAGIPRAFGKHDFTVVTIGYTIMRIAMISQWLRAAHDDTEGRSTALRYAVGLTVCQLGWLARLALHGTAGMIGFAVLVVVDLSIPVWAERSGRTPWHPGHIAERYGLFTIIVLGESILGAANAVQSSLNAGHSASKVLTIAAGGVLIVFAMWWAYFDQSADSFLQAHRESLTVPVLWGYGHLLIFASAAAVGSGVEGAIAQTTGETDHLSSRGASMAIAIPIALYVLVVWALHARPHHRGIPATAVYLTSVALILAAGLLGLPILAIGILMVALLAVWLIRPTPTPPA